MNLASSILRLAEDVDLDHWFRKQGEGLAHKAWDRFLFCLKYSQENPGERQPSDTSICAEPHKIVWSCVLDRRYPDCGIHEVRFTVGPRYATGGTHAMSTDGGQSIIKIGYRTENPLDKVLEFRDHFLETFVHEYVHAMDVQRRDTPVDLGNVQKQPDAWGEYLSSPSEFNAWFQMCVYKFLRDLKNSTAKEPPSYVTRSFQDFREYFLFLSEHPRKDLPMEWQRRFDRRLYKFYQAFKEDPEKFLK